MTKKITFWSAGGQHGDLGTAQGEERAEGKAGGLGIKLVVSKLFSAVDFEQQKHILIWPWVSRHPK